MQGARADEERGYRWARRGRAGGITAPGERPASGGGTVSVEEYSHRCICMLFISFPASSRRERERERRGTHEDDAVSTDEEHVAIALDGLRGGRAGQ